MAQNEPEPRGPNVDEVLANLDKQAGLSWRLQFARIAAGIDVALTQAHTLVNDTRVHDGTADWSSLAQLAERTAATIHDACNAASLMLACAERNVSTTNN